MGDHCTHDHNPRAPSTLTEESTKPFEGGEKGVATSGEKEFSTLRRWERGGAEVRLKGFQRQRSGE